MTIIEKPDDLLHVIPGELGSKVTEKDTIVRWFDWVLRELKKYDEKEGLDARQARCDEKTETCLRIIQGLAIKGLPKVKSENRAIKKKVADTLESLARQIRNQCM